jgi:riboflavin synthase
MFNGIIHTHGKVIANKALRENREIQIHIPKVKAKNGDSIAINGACLTVVKKVGSLFTFHVMPQTLNHTTLGELKQNDKVNAETSMKLGDTVGGHFISGHMDTVTTVKEVKKGKQGVKVKFGLPKEFSNLVIKKGSVAVDGVSLSVADRGANWFEVALIPYTLQHTTLGKLKKGDKVNVEFDMLGKYVLQKQ